MAKCYYKLYDLQLVGIDYETYTNWKLNGDIDNNHLYIVTTYNDNNYISNIDIYIGDTKLDANANEIYFETGENTGLTVQAVIEQLQAEFRAEITSSIHFRGVTTTALTDGANTNPIVVNGESFTAVSGDVVIDNNDAHNKGQEYIFDGTYWRAYGDVSDYVLTSTFNDSLGTINEKILQLDSNLNSRIDEEVTKLQNEQNALSNSLSDETNYRINADNKIREDFAAADEALNNKILNDVLGDKDDTISNNTLNGVINEVNEINELLNLLEDSNVIVTYPYVTLLSTYVKQQEVGTTITPDYKITFNAGKYEYGPSPTGCTVDTSNGKGWHASFNGEILNSQSGSFSSIIANDDTNIKLSVYCDYTEGTTPKSDLGRDIEKSKIPAGTTEAKTATLSGYRQVFFGSTTSSFNVDGLSIRNIKTGEVTKSSVEDFTITIVDGAKQVLIAVPNNRKITAIEDKNAFGTDILAKFATSTLKVAGADENVDSEYARDYTVYIYSPDAALSSNTYTVRLANA